MLGAVTDEVKSLKTRGWRCDSVGCKRPGRCWNDESVAAKLNVELYVEDIGMTVVVV